MNCIRLKKECSFYPVDQQPGGESRSRGAVRQTAGSSVASSTSSPAVAGGSPGEMAGMIQSNKGQTTTDDYLPADVKGEPCRATTQHNTVCDANHDMRSAIEWLARWWPLRICQPGAGHVDVAGLERSSAGQG